MSLDDKLYGWDAALGCLIRQLEAYKDGKAVDVMRPTESGWDDAISVARRLASDARTQKGFVQRECSAVARGRVPTMPDRVDAEALAFAMERTGITQSDWPIEVRALADERDAAEALLLDLRFKQVRTSDEQAIEAHLRAAGLITPDSP